MPPERFAEPLPGCTICPRLAEHRGLNRRKEPDWRNVPVPSWGELGAPLLVVGLAPGLRGANRTGRVFTGDDSGKLLFQALLAAGFASGRYDGTASASLTLRDCRISNAVRCWPPANRPALAEIRACNAFLRAELAAMARLRVVLALGRLAHDAVLRARGLKLSATPFRHDARHALPDGPILADSYHVSRLNTNTGRLTPDAFAQLVTALAALLAGPR